MIIRDIYILYNRREGEHKDINLSLNLIKNDKKGDKKWKI